jgi:hypothetical protein
MFSMLRLGDFKFETYRFNKRKGQPLHGAEAAL